MVFRIFHSEVRDNMDTLNISSVPPECSTSIVHKDTVVSRRAGRTRSWLALSMSTVSFYKVIPFMLQSYVTKSTQLLFLTDTPSGSCDRDGVTQAWRLSRRASLERYAYCLWYNWALASNTLETESLPWQ